MAKEDLYVGREQTLVKHFILQKYLGRFAHIVGTVRDSLTYVDCFSGPWNVRSNKIEDSSFSIALSELRKARDTHALKGRKLGLRCFFLEKDPKAYAALDGFSNGVPDVVVRTKNASLEESVADIVAFVKEGGVNSFPFIFIDPTGWTGFGMKTIAPLLQLIPGEVLINFMTGHIRRFLVSPQEQTQESFTELFGQSGIREKIQGLAQQDREDVAVKEYVKIAKETGSFQFGCNAIVLHPELDRTHFNLLYLTRNERGIEVFKEIEKKAMDVQEAARADAHQRRRVKRTGQREFLSGNELHNPSHYESLRERYLAKTRSLVLHQLISKKQLPYDRAWLLALSEPLSWESDLKQWIADWIAAGDIEVTGMRPRQRVPHRGEGNLIVVKPKSNLAQGKSEGSI